MSDELPPPFDQVTPRGASDELRARVLAALNRELAPQGETVAPPELAAMGATAGLSSSALPCPASVVSRRRSRTLETFSARAVAASLLIGIGLQAWQWRLERQIEASYYGPKPMPSAVADLVRAVESVTDKQTGRLIGERLMAGTRPFGRRTRHDQDGAADFQGITTYQVSSLP